MQYLTWFSCLALYYAIMITAKINITDGCRDIHNVMQLVAANRIVSLPATRQVQRKARCSLGQERLWNDGRVEHERQRYQRNCEVDRHPLTIHATTP